jgi:hypothetical protein
LRDAVALVLPVDGHVERGPSTVKRDQLLAEHCVPQHGLAHRGGVRIGSRWIGHDARDGERVAVGRHVVGCREAEDVLHHDTVDRDNRVGDPVQSRERVGTKDAARVRDPDHDQVVDAEVLFDLRVEHAVGLIRLQHVLRIGVDDDEGKRNQEDAGGERNRSPAGPPGGT